MLSDYKFENFKILLSKMMGSLLEENSKSATSKLMVTNCKTRLLDFKNNEIL